MTSLATDKRLRNELKDLRKNRLDEIQIIQDETDKFIFYFLMEGEQKSVYANGYYIGKIMLPKNYPNAPGDFKFLTPNGKFIADNKVCLSNTSYHKDEWTPLWSIRNIVIGIQSVFYDDTEHGIAHTRDSDEQRKTYAKDSVNYNMKHFKDIFLRFNQFVNSDGTIKSKKQREKEKKEYEERRKIKKELKKQRKQELVQESESEKELTNCVVEENQQCVDEENQQENDLIEVKHQNLNCVIEQESKKSCKTTEKKSNLIELSDSDIEFEKHEHNKDNNDLEINENVQGIDELLISAKKKSKIVQIKCNKSCSKNNNIQLIRKYVSEIKKMTYDNFDITLFRKVIELNNSFYKKN